MSKVKQDGIVRDIDHAQVDHDGWQTYDLDPANQMPQQGSKQAATGRRPGGK